MTGNAISLISKIHKKANQLIMHELKLNGAANLSPSHGDILVNLYRYKKLTMQEIANKIQRTKATTTVLIDKLEKTGFVKRQKSNDDSRYTNIILTEKGLEFKPVFNKISNILNSALYSGLSNGEIENIELLLEKMYKNLE